MNFEVKAMKENLVTYAREKYAELGVDIDRAIAELDKTPVSAHCWQGDDVTGFEGNAGALSGGIQTTGNYPGRARNAVELRADLDKMLSYVPGTNKVNIHAIYLETDGQKVDRDAIEPKHFENWVSWANERDIGLDFNPTFFSHPLGEGFSLSSADKGRQDFWLEHLKRSRTISDYIGDKTEKLCINNIWFHDGEKEMPIDTLSPRMRLKEGLDAALAVKMDEKNHIDAVESKLFGIGSESYVVGSQEFYLGYCAGRDDVLLTLDAGHFHPTELISAKISSCLLFTKGILLHVSRPVRWDSDHVVLFDDETQAIMREIVRLDALQKVAIATDYFDASINRIMAWTVGLRNTKKALLAALLQPVALLKNMENSGDYSRRLALQEELKTLPLGIVWDYYCETKGVPCGHDWIQDAVKYQAEVCAKR